MVTKDLGMVTAYAYAVAGGYTGTEAQFEQLMADLAIVADDFDNFSVTVTTLPAGSSATASYSDGVLSLGIPKGDKGDKGNTGETGATPNLSVGTVETTAEPTVTITGTAENPVLNFGLVKGDKGDTGEVSEAELDEAVTDLKSELSDIGVEENTTVVPAPRTGSKTINGSGSIVSAAGNYSIYTASVTAGKTYLVTASAHWSSPLYAYYDSNMDLVQIGSTSASGSATTNINNEKTTAPTGATFLISASNSGILDNPILEVDGYGFPRLDEAISDVNDISPAVKAMIEEGTEPTDVATSALFTKKAGYSADVNAGAVNSNISISNNANFDSYVYVLQNDADIYFGESSAAYIALCYGYDYTSESNNQYFCTSPTRKRNIDSNLPTTARTAVSLSAGDIIVITLTKNAAVNLYGLEKAYVFSDNAENQIRELAGSNDPMVATKTATSLTVNMGKLKVVVNKYNDSTSRTYNLWRTKDGFIRKPDGTFATLWENSDSDGVVKIKNEDDFIGGYHGDETQTAFHLFVDGVEYSESATFTDLKFDELILYCESDVYHCNTSATPDVVAFKRKKIITFNKDGYIVENHWTAQEALVLIRAFMGMLSVEKYTSNAYTNYLLTGYHTNHNYAYVDANTGTSENSDLTEVLFHTIYGDVGIRMDEIQTPATYYGDVTNYNEEYSKRLKAYMANIYSNAGASISQGAVIKAKATTFAI